MRLRTHANLLIFWRNVIELKLFLSTNFAGRFAIVELMPYTCPFIDRIFMKTRTSLLIGAGALLAFTAFKKKLAVDGLNIYADETGLAARMEGLTPIIRFRIAIQNASNESATVRSLFGSIQANNYTIGNINSFSAVTIRPNATTYMYCEARMSLLGIASDIFNAIKNQSGINQVVKMQATMNIGGVSIPFTLDYNIAL